MSALTTTDVQRLRDILTSGDRGGFYYKYAQMIRDVSPTAYNQVMTQAQITTYGGLWGGAAIIGNAMAQNQAGRNRKMIFTCSLFRRICGGTIQI